MIAQPAILMDFAKARIASASSAPHTAWLTARKSAPAPTSGPQFSGVIPPMATHGISNSDCHHLKSSGSGRCSLVLVLLGKKLPKAT